MTEQNRAKAAVDDSEQTRDRKILAAVSVAVVTFWITYETIGWYCGKPFGLDALFAGLAFAFLIGAFRLQQRELLVQRHELAITRREIAGQHEQLRIQSEQMKAQNQSLQKQMAESLFFRLLERQRECAEQMVGLMPNSTDRGRKAIGGYSGRAIRDGPLFKRFSAFSKSTEPEAGEWCLGDPAAHELALQNRFVTDLLKPSEKRAEAC